MKTGIIVAICLGLWGCESTENIEEAETFNDPSYDPNYIDSMRSSAIKNGNYHVIIGAHSDEKPKINYNPELDAWVDSMISKKPKRVKVMSTGSLHIINLYYPLALFTVHFTPRVMYENPEHWEFSCKDTDGFDIPIDGYYPNGNIGGLYRKPELSLADTTYEKIKAICREVIR